MVSHKSWGYCRHVSSGTIFSEPNGIQNGGKSDWNDWLDFPPKWQRFSQFIRSIKFFRWTSARLHTFHVKKRKNGTCVAPLQLYCCIIPLKAEGLLSSVNTSMWWIRKTIRMAAKWEMWDLLGSHGHWKFVSFPMKNGGSFQFAMQTFTRGYPQVSPISGCIEISWGDHVVNRKKKHLP